MALTYRRGERSEPRGPLGPTRAPQGRCAQRAHLAQVRAAARTCAARRPRRGWQQTYVQAAARRRLRAPRATKSSGSEDRTKRAYRPPRRPRRPRGCPSERSERVAWGGDYTIAQPFRITLTTERRGFPCAEEAGSPARQRGGLGGLPEDIVPHGGRGEPEGGAERAPLRSRGLCTRARASARASSARVCARAFLLYIEV